MGFALSGAAGAGGHELQEILKRRFLEQIQRQKLAEDARQADMANAVATRQLGQGDQRLGLEGQRIAQDAEQFGVTSGQGQQRIDLDAAEQPVKLRFMGAQAADMERRPQKEADDRRHDFELTGLRGGQEMQQIAASGAEQRKTEGVRIAGAREKAGATTDKQSDYADERGTRIVQTIDDLDKRVSPWTTGVGAVLRHMPATEAKNFAADLNTLKANIAFGELAEMRAASKTGGALGAVSDKELTLLESATGALDQEQSGANLRKNFKTIKESLARWHAAKSGGAPASAATVGGGATQGPKAGERRTINGQLAEWDGKGWLPVK
jgi:hypothetical protein